MSEHEPGAQPEPRPDATTPDATDSQAAARAVRDVLEMRDLWSAELEAAWAEWSRTFPHVDEATLQELRKAFARGFSNVRKQPLLIVVPPKQPPPK
jgi:hypothetical protein